MSYCIADMNPPEPAPPAPVSKPDIREQAVLALLAFGLDRPTATKYVNRALTRHPGCTHSYIVSRDAYDNFLRDSSSSDSSSTSTTEAGLPLGYSENLARDLVGL